MYSALQTGLFWVNLRLTSHPPQLGKYHFSQAVAAWAGSGG